MDIREYLDKHIMIMDGAMGTYFARKKQEDSAISEWANIDDPELIREIHKEYIQAGATLLRTNTFAVNTKVLNITEAQQVQMIRKAYEIAVEATLDVGRDIFIASDIGPIPEHADSNEEETLAEYQRICETFLGLGSKLFLFETFSDLHYIKKLVPFIKEREKDAFIITNFCLNKNGYTKSGTSAKRILEQISDIKGIDACGFNCGIGSGHMYQILKKLEFPKGKYLLALPNAGYPEQMQSRMVFVDNASYFADNMKLIAQLGIRMLGGCCGTTPKYIRLLQQKCNDENIEKKIEEKNEEIVKSIIDDISGQDSGLKNLEVNTSIGLDTYATRGNTGGFIKLFESGKKVIAVELDPPFDNQYDRLIECAHHLKKAGADIITIADSPMGRSRVDSSLMSIRIASEVDIHVMPHICCRDKNMIAMRSTLLGAYINGIRNLLVVTGDPVPSESRLSVTSVFDYNSIQLMNFIKEMNLEHFTDEPLIYGGALNHGRGRVEKVVERMHKKIEAGANYFLTQPVYSNEDVERLHYIREHVDTRILCGIMPLVSYRNANFIKNEITGINVPDSIVNRYSPEMSKEEAEWVGAEIASEIIANLSSFADGYYFMLPFNRVSLMDKIRY
ncbi:MAG TPA: bifunctional homocysteine S-methyltransferase/methylenetetrahydrofolate reductase [Lachnospiraceae bacterium]|nr:bifunctional homocysteine S-methyltransferase/methylenetetrahydrofolate reductase [Lachnospiraceae bacterium]